MIKVAKFGGSSLADAERFRQVKRIVEADEGRRVVVVSALGKRNDADNKITDLLYLCRAHLKYGVSCENIFNMISQRYIDVARELGISSAIEGELTSLKAQLNPHIDEDYLVSRGEYLSARIMAEYLNFDFVDAKECVFFSYDLSIDRRKTDAAIAQSFEEKRGIVIPGFYGCMPNGKTAVMSRGGSDITGALAAAALNADLYENWTDVPGILMADPKIVDDPCPIACATYDELRELSYTGAKVLHEESVLPVREKKIPLNIRDTNQPDAAGTLIKECFDEKDSDYERQFITGIAGRTDFLLVAVHKSHIAGELGTVGRVLEIFDRSNVPIEYMTTGVDGFSFVVSAETVKPFLYAIVSEIEKTCGADYVKITENISLVAAVGRRMAYRPGISGKLFAALGDNGINIRMISQDAEELSIIVGVDSMDFKKTIRVLYNSFIKRSLQYEKM